MNGFQEIIIVGNLGGDPEMRYLPDGTAVANFSVAVNLKQGDSETVTWYRVAAWGKLAEVCNEYLARGRAVLVQGNRLKASAWVDRDGAPRASLELTARTVQFLGGSNGRGEAAGSAEEDAVDSEDIPF